MGRRAGLHRHAPPIGVGWSLLPLRATSRRTRGIEGRLRVVVIGSGFGGLAAAIRLQTAGHAVTIVEGLDRPGGRAYVFEQDGFTFDAGPTIITAPALFEEIFRDAGRRMADYVTLTPLSPFYNVRFPDGTVFRYTGKEEDIVAEIRRIHPSDEAQYHRFAEMAGKIFDAGFALIDTPFSSLRDMIRVLPDLVRLRAHKSVAGLVSEYFADERLRQVFSFHPLLIGGNPFQSSAIYALIHTLEKRFGVWYAMGGTGALVQAMVRLFEELGGILRLNTSAGQIEVDPQTRLARGVITTTGERIPADAVVSNADAATTYRALLPAALRRVNSDRKMERYRYSMSLFVTYFGTDRQYPQVAHHEILMGPRYEALLRDIFVDKRLAPDFSLYLHRPTATDPSMAPPGCDAWYVLSPVPNLATGIDWEREAGPYRDRIMQHLAEHHLPGLLNHVVTIKSVDPRYFRDSLGSYLGSAFSVEPTLTQSAWFRPHNASEDVRNLFLAGAGTHPGAGLPGVLSSGKIAARLALEYLTKD